MHLVEKYGKHALIIFKWIFNAFNSFL